MPTSTEIYLQSYQPCKAHVPCAVDAEVTRGGGLEYDFV